MINNWLSSLRQFGLLVREIYFAPGDFVLSKFAELAPLTAANWGVTGNGDSLMAAAVISGIFWLLMSLVAWRLYRYGRSLVRNLVALMHTAWYRIREAAGSLKTLIVCRLREFVPSRRDDGIDAVPEIDFDDLDLAVLRSAAARGPGLAMSAPEIAEKFKLRPSEVQRSIDKLRRNRMLDTVIGSTDGYGNFRLSPSGATFVAMWQRQHEI
ncbi:MAG TPA: AsnC family protein [Woeseiaceae bacterium]|nr:AsnC family protein [Woeseiaceae bacterium]